VGLALFAVGQGQWWVLAGVLYNHPLDTFVTLPLIEARMLKNERRKDQYEQYQRETPLIIPWFVKEHRS
jgi:protein-S-isoprenylcysteine O-methyltransferase Ste14